MTPDRIFFAGGAVLALVAVGAGAFAAHGLKARLTPDLLATFELAARYQMYHALALMLCAFAWTRWPGPAVTLAAALFLAGIVLFCGSLYLLSLTGIRWLGAVTPLGGAAWLVAWAALAWSAMSRA
ncbi:MAG: DUF423 domain-containing protein [Lautropia sp.]|nr:DUF423 domain-containing protein [Lautropia sp.]